MNGVATPAAAPVIAHTTATTCPYCGVGCGVAVSRENDRLLPVRGLDDHPANHGRLCVKGSALHETTGLQGRLLHPAVLGDATDWDTALDTVACTLAHIIAESGPDAVAFYVSGQLLTEDYYAANKLMKGFIGSANIDTNSRLCMASSVAGHKRAFGSDSVPGCYEDLEIADLLVLVGSNTAWAHPIVYQRIAAARARRPHMHVVVIDPRRTATCDIADTHLAIKPGADAALFNGLLAYLADHQALDEGYIAAHTQGFAATLAEARRLTPDVAAAARQCGLEEATLRAFYARFAGTARSTTVYSQGINQSSSGTDKVNAIINCHLATGRIGLPGASPFSITGQPNAMGGREVGGLANQLAAHMDFTPEHCERVQRFWQSPVIATQPGLKAVDLFEAIGRGDIRAVWIMATNPVVSLPEADRVREALSRCEFVIVSDCIADTDTTRLAHVLLPAAAWGEKDGTVTNSERCISRQRPFLPLPGEARPDWWIISQVAARMGHAGAFAWQDAREVFVEHARLSGFENNGSRSFDISGLAALDCDGYDTLAPVQWPVDARHPDGSSRLFADGHFFTPDGRARFVPVIPQGPAQPTDARLPFVMNTGRIRDQWHTMTRTARSPRLLQHTAEPYAELHPQDAARLGLHAGGIARVHNDHGELLLRVKENPGQQRGSVFVPMHWTGIHASHGRMGVLVNAVTDPVSGQPESKHAPVAIEAWPVRWQAFLACRETPALPAADYWVHIPQQGGVLSEWAGTGDAAAARAHAQACLGTDAECLWFEDRARGIHRQAWLRDGRLQAVLCLGPDAASLPERSWLVSCLGRSEPLTATERRQLLSGRAAGAAADPGAIICSCFQVGENSIRAAIAAGATTTEALGKQLKCGTNCGSCLPELRLCISAATARA